jgi:hypothetical protein
MKTHKITIHQRLTFAVVLVSGLLLTPTAYAAASTDKAAGAKKPIAEKTPAEKSENLILSIIAADVNADKQIDTAILLKSEDQADLYLYLGNATGDMALKLVKKNLVWSGALAGTLPQLKMAKGGGIFIYSENDAIGRDRWHQRLSVDYRDNDFVVTGYTYDAQDTLDPKSGFNCDVNLLTGGGIQNKKPFKIAGQKIKLTDWADEKIPKQCHP